MIIIEYLDWQGAAEELEEYCSAIEEAISATPDSRYIGRFRPVNSMYTHAVFMETKDYTTWDEVLHNFHYKAVERKTLPHLKQEFFR